MQRAVSILLSSVFALLILCPGLCLAQAATDKRACCHKGKAGAKPCTHAEKMPHSEAPAVVFAAISPTVPTFQSALQTAQPVLDLFSPQPLRTALAPPLVLRI